MTASAHRRRPILRAPNKKTSVTAPRLTGLFAIGTPTIDPRRMAEALAAHAKKGDAE